MPRDSIFHQGEIIEFHRYGMVVLIEEKGPALPPRLHFHRSAQAGALTMEAENAAASAAGRASSGN